MSPGREVLKLAARSVHLCQGGALVRADEGGARGARAAAGGPCGCVLEGRRCRAEDGQAGDQGRPREGEDTAAQGFLDLQKHPVHRSERQGQPSDLHVGHQGGHGARQGLRKGGPPRGEPEALQEALPSGHPRHHGLPAHAFCLSRGPARPGLRQAVRQGAPGEPGDGQGAGRERPWRGDRSHLHQRVRNGRYPQARAVFLGQGLYS
mmetsp:Transcript_9098/g.32734  ORF Transcript_9098/g.32734 Transcript_9098/m.32734 type:complete len:207 (+) Transcript_9098:610-1230(+)